MEMVRVDTQRVYEVLWDKITTLELAPGTHLNEQELAEELDMAVTSVREALRLLAHEDLVKITPRHGIYVADVNLPDLQQISEIRISLEALSARLAAQRASEDDLVVLDSLRHEHATVDREDTRRLFDVDHKFHQAIAEAAGNKYLADTLERYFGLSLRLWYMVLPQLGSLFGNVKEHLELVDAIRTGDADQAEQMMHDHVSEFYARVRKILEQQAAESNEDA
jgi:DNA-binding GntR family transcriptional regulator